MKLKYLKEEKMEELLINMETNRSYYENHTPLVTDSDLIESDLNIKNLELLIPVKDSGNYDFENVKIIYEALKDLSLIQATDQRIWTALTHGILYDYTAARWGTKSIKERFLCTKLIRNAAARLWWFGYASYDPTFEDPYTLTEYLISKQDIPEAIMGRSFSRNPDFVRNILKAIHELMKIGIDVTTSTVFRNIAKHLNRISGLQILDLMTVEEIKEIMIKYAK